MLPSSLNFQHWHSLLQKADDPAFVNQCRIAKGNPCLYTVDSTNQPRTCWYHSHLSTQYCDGLRGPFVIYDPNDPHSDLYNVNDKSTILTLSDWYHTLVKELKLLDSSLLLAQVLFYSHASRWSQNPMSDLAVITVEQGKRLGHAMPVTPPDFINNVIYSLPIRTIIEVDNVNYEPYTIDQIQIFAGKHQFSLTANQKVDNYWICVLPSVGTSSYTNGINSASILQYSGGPEGEPAIAMI
ncbi:laccase 1 [Armillaria mellea]|nr:laccase 1 [Armillaria mellea]